MKLVTTPVAGYDGKVGNVTFVNGQAKVSDDATELAYFRSAGYAIADFDDAVKAAEKAKDQDAAEKLDELNGQGGTRDDDPQVVKEVDGEQQVLPRKSASTDTWRRFAVDHGGLSEDEANGLSRDELVARFTADDDEEKP